MFAKKAPTIPMTNASHTSTTAQLANTKYKIIKQGFFKKGANLGLFDLLFSVFSNKHHYNFYNKCLWKNVHPVYGAGIWTLNLRNLSLLP